MGAGKGKNSQTFIVKITRGRESNHGGKSNWSGKVVFAETGEEKEFKSGLELIRMIDHKVEDALPIERGLKPYDKPIAKIWEQVHAGEDGSHKLISPTDAGNV